ncbi:MAG: hypothetical protein OXC80_05685, partial [Gammaproteobacteria bacterium]|nr:hypothetical protein [Gammaproteobacteria bacterium]
PGPIIFPGSSGSIREAPNACRSQSLKNVRQLFNAGLDCPGLNKPNVIRQQRHKLAKNTVPCFQRR